MTEQGTASGASETGDDDSGAFDKARAKAFMATMVGVINSGALSLMISIGHRTGLFDKMAGQKSFTSLELAQASNLDERYVREWLAAMAAGGVIDLTAGAIETEHRFVLPAEHEKLVTRAGGPLNLAAMTQYVALMGQVEDDVVESFSTGAGVPYSRYPAFQALMAEGSGARFDAALISEMLPLMPGSTAALQAGTTLADVGCGSGKALLMMAEAYPNSTFTGFDFSPDGIAAANAKAQQMELSNVTFVEADAAELTANDEFDFITSFDAIHDQGRPRDVLAGIRRALRDGGTYLCVEPRSSSSLEENIKDPMAPYLYSISTMHCMSVALVDGGEGLGTAWGAEKAHEYLNDAGFSQVETHEVGADRTNSYFVAS